MIDVQPRPYASSQPRMGSSWVKAIDYTRRLALHWQLLASLQGLQGRYGVHVNYGDACRAIRQEDFCINLE